MNNEVKSVEWSRKQKRAYHRLISLLNYWEGQRYQILRVDLTSSPDSDYTKLRNNHDKLRKKIERILGFKGIETYILETREGYGVLHCIWAWKQRDGFREKNFFVSQKWLSKEWERLHRAKIVWVAKYDKESFKSKKRVSRYFVSQYVIEQSFVRYSYSWGRTLGFPLVKLWNLYKEYYLHYERMEFKDVILNWSNFMRGKDPITYFGKLTYVEDLRNMWDKEFHK